MSPRLGSVFGHYRIESILGRGGMGIVYLATDLSLDRAVAIKVLTPDLADDPVFRARFEREARLAAAVEHPSIITIYGTGQVHGQVYLAMRYVPGQDLGLILRAEAPLSVERTISLLDQVADGLDAAHRRGLVHRDVKPANIIVQADDEGPERAFLVDFGLTRRSTSGMTMTRTGQLLGTIDAIAPEQIRGESVDGRTDGYSLACLLFHCLTGSPPFMADRDEAVLFAHLHLPPRAASQLVPGLPAAMDDVIARGMAKAPAERYGTCRALMSAARQAAGRGGDAAAAVATSGRSATRRLPATTPPPTPTLSASHAAHPPSRAAPHRHLPISPAAALGVAAVLVAGLAAFGSGIFDVGRGSLASPTPSPIASVPPSAGGSPASAAPPSTALGSPSVAPSPLIAGLAGTIVFVAETGGVPDVHAIGEPSGGLIRLTDDGFGPRHPSLSPDGHLLAFDGDADGNRDIYVMGIDGTDLRRLTTHPGLDEQAAWSPDGQRIAFVSDRAGDRNVYVIDLEEADAEPRPRRLTFSSAVDEEPAWSPDGTTIAVTSDQSASSEIWLFDAEGEGSPTQITSGPGTHTSAAWSTDGAWIAAVARGTADGDLVVFRPDGSDERIVLDSPAEEHHPTWSPDGNALAFTQEEAGVRSIALVDVMDGSVRPVPLGSRAAFEPHWSSATGP